MLYFAPLASYVAALIIVLMLLGGAQALRSHILFWMFIAYSAPYALRFALQTTFYFPFSSADVLGREQFLTTAVELGGLLVLSAVVYRLSYQFAVAGHMRDRALAHNWSQFTSEWGPLVFRYLAIIAVATACLGIFVQFVVLRDRFTLGFAADVESRQASMGWSFVPFILAQITLGILLIGIELDKSRRTLALLFLAQVVLALSSGSKGGFLLPLTYCLAFALHRGRLVLTKRHLLVFIGVAFASLVLGISIRGFIESGTVSPRDLLNPINLFGPALGRFFAYDLTQIMMANPATYTGIIHDFRAYFVGAVVPSALWPGKPLNPCLLLADSVGFPFVSCVAPGWVGGALILVGPIGAVLAPVLVGVSFALLTWRSSLAPDTPSLRHPLTFSVGLLWLALVNEGTYYQLVPAFLPVMAILVTLYVGVLALHGRMSVFPSFIKAIRKPKAEE